MSIYFLALAVVASWALSWRVPTRRQREVAVGLSVLLAINLIRIPYLPDRLDAALFMAWYAVTTVMAIAALGVPRPWIAFLPFVALAVAPAPAPNHIAFWLALAVQTVAAVRCVIRLTPPDQVETVGLLLAASSLADVAGPWLAADVVSAWPYGRLPAVITWIVVAGWEVRCWIRARRRAG